MEDCVSLEYLSDYSVFEKLNMIRRTSEILTKVADSGPKMVLPKNIMIHLLDNMSHCMQSTDTFNLDNYPFLSSKSTIKHVHHFIDLDKFEHDDLAKFSHRIYRPKLIDNIRNFSLINRKKLIPDTHLDTIIDNRGVVILTNYNPLYRLISTNDRPINHYYRYQSILKVVLKEVAARNRNNFIVIPIPDNFDYIRSNLMTIVNAGKVTSQLLLNSSHFYFFMIDLIALLLEPDNELFTLKSISNKNLGNTSIMFTRKDKSIVVNIGTLASLTDSKVRAFNFLDSISALSHDRQIEEPEIEVKTSLISGITSPIIEEIDVSEEEEPVNSPEAPAEVSDEPDDIPIKEEDKLDEIDLGYEEDPSELQLAKRAKDDVLRKDVFIETHTDLTPAQKTRALIVSEKYKSIKVNTSTGPKTIHEIVSAKTDISIKPKLFSIIEDRLVDKSMAKSSNAQFNIDYCEKLLHKDILKSVLAFQDNGLYVTGYEEYDEYNSFNRIKHFRVAFEDIAGKKHTVKFKLPIPDEDGYYLAGGIKLSMSQQLVNVPICKISPSRVSLISNYNKTLVDKVGSVRHSILDKLAKEAQNLNIKLVPKYSTYIDLNLPYEYKLLGSKYLTIINKDAEFYFNYNDRFNYFKLNENTLTNLHKFGVLVGKKIRAKDEFYFMTDKYCTLVNIKTANIIEQYSSIITAISSDFKVPFEWCDLKILDKNLPIIFILAYKFGLSTILEYLKNSLKYRFVRGRDLIDLKPTEMIIQFSDGKLIIDRYPLLGCYIVAGLAYFSSLKRYKLSDLDDVNTYYQIISDKGISINYLKGINNYFSFFIDPITKEILEEMREPTNTKDLLIRAVQMLVSDKDKAPSSISNFRLRSSEKLPSIVYNEISRQYANYVSSNHKDISFSINTEAVYQRILQDQTMALQEELNPIHAIKEAQRVTYTGFGGRSAEAFVEKDRKYPKDAVGILAETTTDSGSVGMVSAMTSDPNIKNLRGLFNTESKNIKPANILSDTSLLMPCVTHDDQHLVVFV